MKDVLLIVANGSFGGGLNHVMHQRIRNKSLWEHLNLDVIGGSHRLYFFEGGPHIEVLVHRIYKVAARFEILNVAKDLIASTRVIHGVILKEV